MVAKINNTWHFKTQSQDHTLGFHIDLLFSEVGGCCCPWFPLPPTSRFQRLSEGGRCRAAIANASSAALASAACAPGLLLLSWSSKSLTPLKLPIAPPVLAIPWKAADEDEVALGAAVATAATAASMAEVPLGRPIAVRAYMARKRGSSMLCLVLPPCELIPSSLMLSMSLLPRDKIVLLFRLFL